MGKKFIGSYYLGYDWVDLYLRDGVGGDFDLLPETNRKEGSCARISMGVEQKQWSRVMTSLLHEAMELAITKRQCRFWHAQGGMNDLGGFFFFMDHRQFTEVCGDAGEFMAKAQHPLYKQWNEWWKRRKRGLKQNISEKSDRAINRKKKDDKKHKANRNRRNGKKGAA